MSYGITKEELHPSLIQYIQSLVGSAEGNNSLRFMKNTVTLNGDSKEVNIGIEGFNKDTDLLLVYKNSIYLEYLVDFNISSDNTKIVAMNGETYNSGDQFNFVALINCPELSEYVIDGNKIQDYSIDKTKLNAEFVQGIEDLNDDISSVNSRLDTIMKYAVGVIPYRFQTINSAYNQWITDGKPLAIIKIHEGEYNEYLNIGGLVNNNRLVFEGVDKNLVTWKYVNGNYDYAPFTGGGNITFKNLTVIADHPEDWTGNGGAYGLHIDHPNARGKVIIENCDLYSYQDSALGCGTSQDQEIWLKYVNLYHYAEVDSSGGTNGVNHGALLYHTSATPNSTGQKIHFENVYAWSKNGPGIQILSSGNGNTVVNATFINCVGRSDYYENYGTGQYKESRVIISNDNGMIKIGEDSKNNNSSKLNSVIKTTSTPYKTQYIRLLRDLSLTTDLELSYWSDYEIDYIEVKGYIEAKKTHCNGWYYGHSKTKYLVYQDEVLNNYYINSDPTTAKFICFSQNSLADRIFGDIKTIADGKITISWETKGNGMTGTAQLMFIVHYK